MDTGEIIVLAGVAIVGYFVVRKIATQTTVPAPAPVAPPPTTQATSFTNAVVGKIPLLAPFSSAITNIAHNALGLSDCPYKVNGQCATQAQYQASLAQINAAGVHTFGSGSPLFT